MSATPEAAAERLRVDKWLWQARFFKTRGLAAGLAEAGKLRINGVHVSKAAQTVRPGDVLTFPQGKRIRVIRVEVLGGRRGPAPEARTLYSDLEPPPDTGAPTPDGQGRRDDGSGRPSGRDRREIDAFRRRALEAGEDCP